jgi:hypothetical protein
VRFFPESQVNIAIVTYVQQIIDSGLGGRAKNTDICPLPGFLKTSFHFQQLNGDLREFKLLVRWTTANSRCLAG